MMMVIAGPMIALAMLGAGGTRTNDLVSLLDAKDYFAYHKIDVTPERMAELAGEKPASPAGQIQRLLAVRWLGHHAAAARKSAKAKKALTELAAGQGAQDKFHFAREYALTALARMDGKPVRTKRAVPAGSVAQAALAWFPDSATIFGALDVRRAGETEPLDVSPIRALLTKQIPAPGKQVVYEVIDRLGNVRLDRVSFAYIADAKDHQKSRIFIRFTGLGSHKAMLAFLDHAGLNAKPEERKGPRGEPITVIADGNPFSPAFVLVGDTDLLVAGYEGRGDSVEVANLALDVRAGKKDSIVKGSFGDALKDVPTGASGLLMGDLPDELRSELTGGGSLFKAAPKTISAVLIKGKTLQIKAEGVMASAEDATTLADNIVQLKTMGIAALGQLPPQLGVTPAQVKMIRQALESVKAQAKADSVSAGIAVSGRTVALLGDLMAKAFAASGGIQESRPAVATPIPIPAAPPAKR